MKNPMPSPPHPTPRPSTDPQPAVPLPGAEARADAAFNSALNRAPAEREAFLAEACGDDQALRQQVRELLAAHDAAGGFMDDTELISPRIEEEMARLQPEKPGDWIGPYKLLQQIGEGGFGVVWMAEQEQPVRRRVALKIIKMGMDTREVIARFEQERQALAMMEHPNIARVLDAGATPFGRPFFVMELVRGIRITDFCDQANLAMEQRLELYIQVCQAVQHAHQKGIIHRDLKPSNILVTLHDGVPVPKVIDFGVAKATQQRLTDKTLFTQFEQMIGTPLYMSPEQAEMSGLDVDTRTDIYALGVLLYELLTGRTPFDPETLAQAGYDEIRRVIREQDPPRPSTALHTMAADALTLTARHRHTEAPKLLHAIRGDLDWIVMKCLEKDRTRRYETANEVAADLRRHLAMEPVVARPPSRVYRLRRMVQRHRAGFAAGAAVAVAMILGTVISVWQAVRAERAGRRAEIEARKATSALADLRAMAPALSAQARSLVSIGRLDEAVEKLDHALKLQPGARDLLLARADLLESQLKLDEAAAAYRAVLQVAPEDPRAIKHAALCERLSRAHSIEQGPPSRENLSALYQAMVDEQRPAPELLPIARLLGEDKNVLLAYWRTRLAELPLPAGRPLDERLEMRDDGLLRLDLSGAQLSDLAPVTGMPLGALVLAGCSRVADLTSLRGLPLKELDLTATAVTDLRPLQTLTSLETLRLADCPTLDLTPLAGLPIRELHLRNTPASDLSPLRGLPLRVLILGNSANVRGLQVLAEVRALERLVLPWSIEATPAAELEAVDALRAHPSLRQIGAQSSLTDAAVSTAIPGRDEFFREWDQATGWRLALHRQGAEIKVSRARDSDARLEIKGRTVHDLSALRGLTQIAGRPLRELIVSRTAVADLSPITGLPLRQLNAEYTRVSDLAPLRGMPLELLRVTDSPVESVAPLAGMKTLRDLGIGGTAVTDLAPLTGLPIGVLQANKLQLRDLEPLRGMPLKQLFLFDAANVDLAPLSGSSIELLHLGGAKISDLAPLAGCAALRHLWVSDCNVRDLSPLAELKLVELHLGNTRVRDLRPLSKLPLRVLTIDRSPVEDVTPLRDIPTLEQLVVSRDAPGLSGLRSHPRLAWLATRWDAHANRPGQTATEFWTEFDRRKR